MAGIEDPDGKPVSCLEGGDGVVSGGDGDGCDDLFGGGPGGKGGGDPGGRGGWKGTSGTVGSFGSVCHCGLSACGETLCCVGIIGRGS